MVCGRSLRYIKIAKNYKPLLIYFSFDFSLIYIFLLLKFLKITTFFEVPICTDHTFGTLSESEKRTCELLVDMLIVLG